MGVIFKKVSFGKIIFIRSKIIKSQKVLKVITEETN